MGRLLSDAEFRLQFFGDRAQAIQRLGVDDATATLLMRLDRSAIERQAKSLISKRCHQVRKSLPITAEKLASDFDQLFQAFAETFWPTGHRRHIIDAVHFCRHLRLLRPECVCSQEHRALEFVLSGRRIAVRLFNGAEINNRRRCGVQLQLKLPSQAMPVEYVWSLPCLW